MYTTTDYLLFGKINRSNVNISTQIITDFLSGDHKRIASSLLNWYSDQAIKQIEDRVAIANQNLTFSKIFAIIKAQ